MVRGRQPELAGFERGELFGRDGDRPNDRLPQIGVRVDALLGDHRTGEDT